MITTAAILAAPPESGSIDEVHFDAFGLCTWVEFEVDGEQRWAGAFGRGEGSNDDVAIFDSGRRALVIARGQAYVVNVSTRTQCHKSEHDYLVRATAWREQTFVIACDFVRIFAINTTGIVWRSERIASDGIEFERCLPDRLVGRVWLDSDWYGFTLMFDGWRFKRDTMPRP